MSRLRKSVAVGLAAVAVVAAFEGLRTRAYRDQVGVATICYGETLGVKMGHQKTVAECREMLVRRLDVFEAGIRKCLKNPDAIPDGAYVASISLAYNVGIAAFCGSSIRRKFDAGDYRGACDAFLLYNKAGGKVLPGLVKRRQAERNLCLKGKL